MVCKWRVDYMVTMESLIEEIKEYNPTTDESLIRRAYAIAEEAHDGQRRDSGEEYIHHPLSVAHILAGLQLDDYSIAAGLLHDVVEDTKISLDDLRKEFPEELVSLVDGVTKLGRVEYRSRQEQQMENLRKLFLAMGQDIRIIMIKLADRLHNMRTLSYHHSQLRQKEIAQETVDIYAPLAHRLGIYKIKSELEDLSLKYLEPDKYFRLVEQISMKLQERQAYIDEICKILGDKLKDVGIKAELKGRPKNFYSIYNKMMRQKKELNEIFDLTAVRIIVDNINDCYGALGVVHTLWKPIPGRFKDYIAMPKQNMYQSIHTTVIGPSGEPFEVQIRTWEMHRIAEYGIAAHWRYKEGSQATDAAFDEKLVWLRQMLDWQQELRDAQEFMNSIKVDLFTESVYVFSPKGDVFELPAGANCIDFAYRVHTQVGHNCIGAKVNKRIVTLDYELKNGDIVEILTTKGKGPSLDWLKIVKTSQAKNKIRQWFKREQRDDHLIAGKEILEKECKKYNLDAAEILKTDKLLELAKKFNYFSIEDFYVSVGSGALSAATALSKLGEDKKEKEAPAPEVKPWMPKGNSSNGVWVKGQDNLLVRMAHCCNPLPGDEIAGYITRGRGVTVHRKDCINIQRYKKEEAERLIEVTWDSSFEGVYQVEMEVLAMERPRLILDVMRVVTDTKTIINGVNSFPHKENKTFSVILKLEIKSLDHLDYIMSKVRKIKDVLEVKRVTSKEKNKE